MCSSDLLQAKRSIFGMEPTQHLLAKFDALQKPGALGEARIDADQFNFYAQQMGLRPNEPKQSEDQKNALITTRNNVETILASEELQKKRKLTRPEKDEIMQREVARQVTLHNTIFPNQTGVPLVAVPQDRRGDVVVPEDVSKQAMRIMDYKLQRATSVADRKRLQPTKENIQRFVLENPELIPAQAQ